MTRDLVVTSASVWTSTQYSCIRPGMVSFC